MEDFKKRLREPFLKALQSGPAQHALSLSLHEDRFSKELGISRPTATKYLKLLTGAGFLETRKIGRSHFYVNRELFRLLSTIQLPAV